MPDQSPKPDPDRPAKTERRGPIPLADRRRLVRSNDTPAKKPHVISDWASI